MAYPPDTLPTDNTDATASGSGFHADDLHNAANQAINDIVDILGGSPEGAFGSVGSRVFDAENRLDAAESDISDLQAASGSSGLPLSTFGDGSDGNAVFDGSGAVTGASRSGTTYTLTRDVYYDDATLSAGVTVDTAGFRVFCRGTLTIPATATLGRAGGNALNNNAGAGGVAGTLSAGSNGGNGGNGTSGAAGTAATNALGGVGGRGGNEVAGTSASAPGAATLSATMGDPRNLVQALSVRTLTAATFAGGSGASGGDATAGSIGGGGGGGCPPVGVYADSIVVNGVIQAKGGNGANAQLSSGTGAGGGGGGGGGAVILVRNTRTGSGTIDVSGGTGGTGAGTGQAGEAGNAGTVIELIA